MFGNSTPQNGALNLGANAAQTTNNPFASQNGMMQQATRERVRERNIRNIAMKKNSIILVAVLNNAA